MRVRGTGRKWLSLLLTICVVLGMLPGTAAAADTTFSADKELSTTAISTDTVWTVEDGVIVTVSGTITIRSGATLTLQGDGTFLRNFKGSNGMFYVDGGKLIIDGVTIDGNGNNITAASKSNVVRIEGSGSCLMKSGTIQNCKQETYGAAIYVSSSSSFTMEGGTIQNNTMTSATSDYGGAGLYNLGTATINGGIFTGNSATCGGAIYNASYGKLTINGGKIYGNTATKNGSGLPYGNSVFHSSKDGVDGQLYLGGAADIQGDIYLDNTSASKFVYLTSALQHPLAVTCGEAVEGRVVVQGSVHTVTAQDMARLSIKNKGCYFGLSDDNNQIFITATESEAYIPITIKSDDSSLDVELNQSVTLDYSESAGGYIGSVPAGQYDVYVGGTDTGNGITVSSNNTMFDSSVLLAPHVHPIDNGMENTTFDPLSSLEATLGPGNYYLTKDLTNNTGGHITVSGNVILCLNGKTLDLNGKHIIVPTDASLTLCDCGSGKITGQSYTDANSNGYGSVYVQGGSFTMYSGSISGNNAYSGGGVTVSNGGRFTMYGGSITSNTAQLGSGVAVSSGGSFTMRGGTISGNESTYGSAGVNVARDGSFTMYDGSITNNHATGTSGSGGVQVNGSFTMYGGEISGNTAYWDEYGGGVHVNGSFTISGDASITGNTSRGSNCNVYLDTDAVITIGGKLTGGKIGVKMAKPGTFTSGWNTIMGDAAPSGYFSAEDSSYLVARTSDGEAMLHQHSYTYTADSNTITERCACGHRATATISVPADADLTYTGSAVTPAEVDYSTGWQGGDLTPDYENNTDVGTATAKITKDTATASVMFEIARAAQTAPGEGEGYVINYAAETIAIQSGYEVYTDESASVRIENGRAVTPGTTYYIRKAETTTHNPSDFTAFTVTARPATPAAPEVTDRTDTSITISTNPECEYSINGGSWVSATGSYTFENLKPGTDYTISVRVAATESAPVSESASASVTTKTAPVKPPAEPGTDSSAITVTDGSITITGSVSGQEYIVLPKDKTPDESDWTSAQSGSGESLTFDGLTPGTEYTVWTRSEETDSAMPSQPSQSGVTTAAETPDSYADGMSIDYADEIITVKHGYEISTDGQNWSTSAEFTPGETYYVRVQEQGGIPASDSVHFTAPSRPAQPGDKVAVTGETIKGQGDGAITVPSGMEYSTDGGESWTPGPATLKNLKADTTVIVREQATATVPHGVEQTYTVPASEKTLTVTFDENGGSDVADATELSYNAPVTAPEITRTGYTLDGWYNGDVQWDFSSGVTENITLTAKWTLDAPTVSLTANKTEATYGEKITLTATPLHATSVSYSYKWYKDGAELGSTNATLTIENVSDSGSYTVKVTASDGTLTSNPAQSSAVAVTINRANPVTVWPIASDITYGDNLSKSKLTGGSAVSGDFAWEDGSVNPASGSREYTVVFTPDDKANYNVVEQPVAVYVAQKKLTASVNTVENKVYDGDTATTGTIELTGAVLGDKPTAGGVFTFENANAGTNKTVNITVTLNGTWGNNYVLAADSLTAEADITPKTVGLTWSGYEGLVYDGEAVSVTAEATGLIGGDTCTVTVENGGKTDVGTYTAKAIGLGNDNYVLPTTGTTQEYTITPCPVTLSWDEDSFTYDDSKKTVTATVTNAAVQTDTFHLEYTGNTQTAAGDSYEAKVTALGNPNYTLDGGTGLTHRWTISKAVISFTVTSNTHTYDGNAKTAVVTQSEGQTPIPVNGYTIKYGGENSQTEADTYDITVTISDPNFCFEGGDASKVVGQLTIGKKTITGTWTDIKQVYDDDDSAAILPDDLEAGDSADDIHYHYTGTTAVGTAYDSDTPPEVAGTYTVTATMDNYTITNNTATLVIEKKPVTVTVTDNAVQADGTAQEPEIQIPGLSDAEVEALCEVVYKDKNGNVVENPTQPGAYEVWVEFTDPNYRHPDGSTSKQVGTFTIANGQPALYTVTFDGNGKTSGTMTNLELAGGSILTLPDCGYAKTGSQFTGWLYDGRIYKPGNSFTTPYTDVTFTAQWQAVFEVRGTIKEETGSVEQNVANAVVSLWLGANKIAETNTDSNGSYSFGDLLPGIYNLVVSKDQRTVTSMVEITTADRTCNALLPQYVTNSVVDITPGSPDIVVGNLDEVFDEPNGEDYTEEDAQNVQQNGSKVEITFKVDEQQEDEVGDETVKKLQSAGESNLSLFLDCTLTKTVTSGNSTTTSSLTQSSVLLEILLPLPTELQGKYTYTISRIHEGEAQTVPQGEGSKNADGEYFTVSEDKTALILHVKNFSTYAMGYRNAPSPSRPTYPPVKHESENGSFTVSPSTPSSGQKVTITPKPDEGYVVDRVTVTDKSGKDVTVTPNANGTYTFTQPSGSVTITVTVRKDTGAADCPRDESCPMAAFTDVNRNAWYHDGIHYCLEHGLMTGTGEAAFSPDIATTRGMIVTILWRLEGSPVVDGSVHYSDVKPGDWYEAAVRWAEGAGVVTGYGNHQFGPNDPITREQMAVMLWRYAGSPDVEDSLSSFADEAQTSDWARPAMSWAVKQGLISGIGDNQLWPGGEASRAQAATILMRFAQAMAS